MENAQKPDGVKLVQFIAPPVVSNFFKSNAPYSFIMGPYGSGKTSALCMEVYRRAAEQEPGPDGIRHTRCVIVRNTFRQLEDTTIKTWLEWFPENVYGVYNKTRHNFFLRAKTQNSDKIDIHCDIEFRALDRPDHIANLLSAEYSFAFFNEVREIPLSIVISMYDRTRRFPPAKDGGHTWGGVFGDTNPPDDDSWYYKKAELERPEGWEFFKQPGALVKNEKGKWVPNPEAENIQNLKNGYGYYLEGLAGKTDEYISVYYGGNYGFILSGRPVYPEYCDSVHCAEEELEPVKGLPIYVGIDFGLTPAAVFGQCLPNGRWIWFDELVTYDDDSSLGVLSFADQLGPMMRGKYKDFSFLCFGDPAGSMRAETEGKTIFEILRAKGIVAYPAAKNNDFFLRREAVANLLKRMVDGKPGLMLSPRCKFLRKAMAGGYCFKRVQVVGYEKYRDKPDKDKFSHVAEAGQYLALGAGEGQALVNSGFKEEPFIPNRRKVLMSSSRRGSRGLAFSRRRKATIGF